MDYLHAREIIHSDLKCLNVLLDVDEAPKVADFGLSKILTINGAASQQLLSARGKIF